MGVVDWTPGKEESKTEGSIIGAPPIIGGQPPVGPQPAPVGTGKATRHATAPHDDSRRDSASLRIGEILLDYRRGLRKLGRAARDLSGPKEPPNEAVHPDETLVRTFLLLGRSVSVELLSLAWMAGDTYQTGVRRSQASGREHNRRLGPGEGQIPADR